MVIISIVRKGKLHRTEYFQENSPTAAVIQRLIEGYGKGVLKREGFGVVEETLKGQYEFHLTEDCLESPTQSVEMNSGRVSKINHSTSCIVGSNRDAYDCFGLPLPHDGFVPNERIRKLIDLMDSVSDTDTTSIRNGLRVNIHSMQSWKYPEGGSETMLVDNILKVVMEIIASCTKEESINCCSKRPLPFSTLLANSAKPEYSVTFDSHVLIGSECKGVEASHFEALPQVLQVCGDSAVHLYKAGLAREDCVVPGVVVAGESLQIMSVYLMADCFPVLVEVTPLLSLYTVSGQRAIAKGIVALSKFAVDTKRKLDTRPVVSSRDIECIALSTAFLKPIRNNYNEHNKADIPPEYDISTRRITVNKMMHLYKSVSKVEKADTIILFPTGLLSIPSATNVFATNLLTFMESLMKRHFPSWDTHQPVLVFPYLEGWTNDKPPKDYVDAYIAQITTIVEILNTANVAHMDLRPQNIMWRIDNNNLECRLIDLENAVYFGDVVEGQNDMRNDSRYPVRFDEQRPLLVASAVANEWFLCALTDYCKSDYEDFIEFMNHQWQFYENYL